ncbi:phosphatidate cytidylyltransferase [Terrisporobacter petrolearius]|uniref:phosphatidate cytidylyltransferase n=1 Tax=Terrisporobacter petrolearius TaxID=1460447 RepID=UPI001D16EAF4|nr:phosphatidate cytidylyltransferase [Terrisporobacter petrolearius]MCC3864671.1 phosphatidate cytidylyltransferase [Terrisporobacter petrolearius]
MRTRVIAGLLLVPLFILIIFGGTPLYIGEAIIISIALNEFYKAFEQKDIKPLYYIGYIFSIYLLIKNYLQLPISYTYTLIFILFLISIIPILTVKRNIIDIVVTFFGVFYVAVLIDFIVLTMDNFSKGDIYVWLIFIIAFMTDTFAYFAGYLFGKHKLIPKVSPKKTVEGSVGGILGSTLICLTFGYFFNIDLKVIVFLGFFGSIVAQFGDLFASSIKRYVGIKDYGKLIPGHGGILDRFDSVILVAPFVYSVITLFIK